MDGGNAPTYAGGWSVPSDFVVQATRDFNGDGKADILWRQTSTGTVLLWLMNGGNAPTSAGGWTVPTDYIVQAPASRRLTLGWQDNSSNESGFKIERSPDGSTNWTEIAATGPNITSYQDAGLAPTTTYFYRVRAYTTTNTSAYSNVTSATTR